MGLSEIHGSWGTVFSTEVKKPRLESLGWILGSNFLLLYTSKGNWGPKSEAPVTHMGDLDSVPISWLWCSPPGLLQALGKRASRCEFSLSTSLSLSKKFM